MKDELAEIHNGGKNPLINIAFNLKPRMGRGKMDSWDTNMNTSLLADQTSFKATACIRVHKQNSHFYCKAFLMPPMECFGSLAKVSLEENSTCGIIENKKRCLKTS